MTQRNLRIGVDVGGYTPPFPHPTYLEVNKTSELIQMESFSIRLAHLSQVGVSSHGTKRRPP